MAQTVYEMMWLRSLLIDLDFPVAVPIPLYCDNQAVIYIANNPTFHERIKHIEVDCNYVREMVMNGIIATLYTKLSDQTADIFTK